MRSRRPRTRWDDQVGCLRTPVRAHEVPVDNDQDQHGHDMETSDSPLKKREEQGELCLNICSIGSEGRNRQTRRLNQ